MIGLAVKQCGKENVVDQDQCNVDNCFVEKKEEIYVSSLKVLKVYTVLIIYD